MSLLPLEKLNITTPLWAISRLGIDSTSLKIFSVIYSIGNSYLNNVNGLYDETGYIGGIRMLEAITGRCKRQVMYAIQNLIAKGIIHKDRKTYGPHSRSHYSIDSKILSSCGECCGNEERAKRVFGMSNELINDYANSDSLYENSCIDEQPFIPAYDCPKENTSSSATEKHCGDISVSCIGASWRLNMEKSCMRLLSSDVFNPTTAFVSIAIANKEYDTKDYKKNENKSDDVNNMSTDLFKNKHETPSTQINSSENLLLGIDGIACNAKKEQRTPSQAKNITFNWSSGCFEGIPETMKENWKKGYPAVDIEIAITQAACWLISNPDKRKSNYARFLQNWLSRCQERGGNKQTHQYQHGGYYSSYNRNSRFTDALMGQDRREEVVEILTPIEDTNIEGPF